MGVSEVKNYNDGIVLCFLLGISYHQLRSWPLLTTPRAGWGLHVPPALTKTPSAGWEWMSSQQHG